MRTRNTYRAHRRNAARADRKIARQEKRSCALVDWRRFGNHAEAANQRADIVSRAAMANAAREAAAKAVMANPGVPPDRIVVNAYLDFYREQKRTRNNTRVVSRIVRDLEQQARQLSQAA